MINASDWDQLEQTELNVSEILAKVELESFAGLKGLDDIAPVISNVTDSFVDPNLMPFKMDPAKYFIPFGNGIDDIKALKSATLAPSDRVDFVTVQKNAIREKVERASLTLSLAAVAEGKVVHVAPAAGEGLEKKIEALKESHAKLAEAKKKLQALQDKALTDLEEGKKVTEEGKEKARKMAEDAKKGIEKVEKGMEKTKGIWDRLKDMYEGEGK